MKVAVIGAGGHVGFPFSLVIADAGHDVVGIDINQNLCMMLNSGVIPYIEYGAAEVFDRVRKNNKIKFTPDAAEMDDCDVIAIMMGTPVDGEGNPRLDDILDFVETTLVHFIKPGALIILRSTVSPGTTEIIRKVLERESLMREGVGYHLVFCPERVAQAHGIEESKKFPQLIGAFSETSFKKAEEFFKTFVDNKCFFLTPREAEVGKLITNMYRYVSFALANEFYMIADKQGVDIHKVINAANHEYGRMAVPLPGPNVGGPCLFKDGKFLLTDIHFSDLIQTSFHINEGMPDYIFNRIKDRNKNLNRILVLGLAFKADCDDTRNSLSYKFMKVCKKNGVIAHPVDPYIHGHNLSPDEIDKSKYDAVVLMTPHTKFKEKHMEWIRGLKNECIIVDVWKSWPTSECFHNGIYTAEDLDY
jgi:UDP-N-acetyl-D-mannosaminuronic acid dehydrogenase